ncbi:twin-arginine translocation signal domain-containing protein [Streptomyces sp. S3(2020)]|nr:twin-arginine translocation signal domain-containing protein [Streptomyces sp. S3(2020)]
MRPSRRTVLSATGAAAAAACTTGGPAEATPSSADPTCLLYTSPRPRDS